MLIRRAIISSDPLSGRDDFCARLLSDEFGGMFATGPVTVTITSYPRFRTKDFDEGTKICVSNWRRLSDNASPSG